jgi:hypothetical protein
MRKRIFYIVLFVGLIFFVSGCRAALYEIKGRVVQFSELKSPAGHLEEVSEQSLLQGGTPVVGARVRMIPRLDEQGRPLDNNLGQYDPLTDENGSFHIKMFYKPSDKLKVGIQVSKNGYKTLYETCLLQGDSGPKVFFVVLAPNGTD